MLGLKSKKLETFLMQNNHFWFTKFKILYEDKTLCRMHTQLRFYKVNNSPNKKSRIPPLYRIVIEYILNSSTTRPYSSDTRHGVRNLTIIPIIYLGFNRMR